MVSDMFSHFGSCFDKNEIEPFSLEEHHLSVPCLEMMFNLKQENGRLCLQHKSTSTCHTNWFNYIKVFSLPLLLMHSYTP